MGEAAFAGVRGWVESLWPADEVTSCVTMERFYRRIMADEAVPPTVAPSAAQRDVRQMTLAQIDEEYHDLGADLDPGQRRRRRWPPTIPPAGALQGIRFSPELADGLHVWIGRAAGQGRSGEEYCLSSGDWWTARNRLADGQQHRWSHRPLEIQGCKSG